MTNSKDTVFFTILLFIVLLLSVFNYRNIDVLESRINTVAKYKVDSTKLDSEKGFKEDYYITQQSHDTNLILVVFGLFVAVTGFFTYKNIDIKFEEKAKELKNEIDMHSSAWFKTKGELASLTMNSLIESTQLNQEIAKMFLNNNDISNFVYYMLNSVSKSADFCNWGLENEYSTFENMENLIKGIKKSLIYIDAEMGLSLDVTTSKYISLSENFQSVKKLNDKELNKLISIIDAKINEVDS